MRSATANPTHHTNRPELPEKAKGLPKNRSTRNDLDSWKYRFATSDRYRFQRKPLGTLLLQEVSRGTDIENARLGANIQGERDPNDQRLSFTD